MFLVDVQFPVSMIDPPWPPSLPLLPLSFYIPVTDDKLDIKCDCRVIPFHVAFPMKQRWPKPIQIYV